MKIKYIGNSVAMAVSLPIGVHSKRNRQKLIQFSKGQVEEIEDSEAQKLLDLDAQYFNENELGKEHYFDFKNGDPAYSKEKKIGKDGKPVIGKGGNQIERIRRQINFVAVDKVKNVVKEDKPKRGRPKKEE